MTQKMLNIVTITQMSVNKQYYSYFFIYIFYYRTLKTLKYNSLRKCCIQVNPNISDFTRNTTNVVSSGFQINRHTQL